MRSRGVDYVIMAGYMRMVHAPLLAAFPNRIVNIHPALLPSFKGAHGIQDAFDYGVKVTGVTVHFADNRYDCGPIIAQRAVAVQEGWTVDELEARIHTRRSCRRSPRGACTCSATGACAWTRRRRARRRRPRR